MNLNEAHLKRIFKSLHAAAASFYPALLHLGITREKTKKLSRFKLINLLSFLKVQVIKLKKEKR